MEVTFRRSSALDQEQLVVTHISQSGFTLIELLIAMAISLVLLAGMVMAFSGQSRSYNTQQEITALQEDLRASLDMMSSEIRLAGYDPTKGANAKVIKATGTEFQFTSDITDDAGTGPGDGDTDDGNENIRYALSAANSLGRDTGGGLQPLAENIEHLAFEYLMDDGTWTPAPALTDLEDIRAVKIAVMGRTPRETSSATDTSAFKPPLAAAPDWTPATPGKFQRRMMSVVVQLRNQQG